MEALPKAKIKQIRALHDRKGRLEANCYVVEGKKMVAEAVAALAKLQFVVTTDALWAEAVPCPVFHAKNAEFDQISTQDSPEGILAVLEMPAADSHARLQHLEQAPPGPAFFLDAIQDPGNLGTIIRIADWFGFKAIVCREGTADCFNPKVLRASMGSIFRVQLLYVQEFEAAVRRFAEQITVADMVGAPLGTAEFKQRPYILLGNEAKGISPALLDIPRLHRVTIARVGEAESLNVAISAGILAHAWRDASA